ncbi:MAG: hypothetical protein M3P83_10805 [Actinomycetota bacterium]|nr:hypothetical protein [Actinomycetota bacterium]
MVHRSAADAQADNLMLTGITRWCDDCAGDRIFVVPDCGDDPGECGDYACTDCGAAVFVGLEVDWPPGTRRSRVA